MLDVIPPWLVGCWRKPGETRFCENLQERNVGFSWKGMALEDGLWTCVRGLIEQVREAATV